MRLCDHWNTSGRQCQHVARFRFTSPRQERMLCKQHATSEFLRHACIDPWTVERT